MSDGYIPPILRLPTELHLMITAQLMGPDQGGVFAAQNLRITNRYFSNIIAKPTHDELLVIENTTWAINRWLYACKFCVRLRPGHKFSENMLNGRTGRNGSQPHKRFCADCGFAPQKGKPRYAPGTEVMVGGERWVWCRLCKKVKKGKAAGRVGCERTCEECYIGYSKQSKNGRAYSNKSKNGCHVCGHGGGKCRWGEITGRASLT